MRFFFLALFFSLTLNSLAAAGQRTVLRPVHSLDQEVKFLRGKKGSDAFRLGQLDLDPGFFDTLSWRTLSSTNMNFDGLSFGDTLAMWFVPLAGCTLKAIRIYCMTFIGNVDIDIWKARYDGHITTEDSTDANGWIGTYEEGQWIPGPVLGHSPLGEHIWGPFPLTLTEETRYSWVEIPTWYVGEPDLAEPFFVGLALYKVAGWGFGAEHEGTVPFHFFKYYAEGVGPDRTHGGWFIRSYSLWVEAVVSYYENTPPEIGHMDGLNDTYGPGPFIVTAEISDKDFENPDQAGVVSAHLHWTISGVEDSSGMEGPLEGGTFTGQIPAIAVGDTVWYWVSAADSSGKRSTNAPRSFARLAPSKPEADILLVDEGWGAVNFYTEVLDSLGYEYQYWNVMQRRGIDASVTCYGWRSIVLFGWSLETTILTRGYAGNVWANFLNTGATENPVHLFYVSYDYFWLNEEPVEMVFAPGDFAYDFLGLISAVDELHAFDRDLYGVAGDTVSGDFAQNPIEQRWLQDLYRNWIVYTTASEEAVDIFFTEADSGSGVRYNSGTFKTVFLPWQFDQLLEDTGTDTVPKGCVYTLVQNVLDWFGTQNFTTIEDENRDERIPQAFALSQNYPNPFNAATTIGYAIPSREQRGESGERRAGSKEQRAESEECDLPTTLKIYNLLGQEVRTFVDETTEAGFYTVTWDGRDSFGNGVASGVYFYRLTVNGPNDSELLRTGQWSETKKMVLLR